MSCNISEEELWSGIDRGAPEVAEHLARCNTCRTRAAAIRAGIEAVAEASTPAAPPLPANIGPYVIQRRLGQGGMGIVYEGQQQTPRRPVAIKVVRGGHCADEYRVSLFQREAQTLALLKHSAIASIYEAGRTHDGQHFFAMELVRGVPLNDYVRDQQIPRRQRLGLFRKICEAINYAHQRGVIHRDLKPTNILVDPAGRPKILDFGLARITDPEAALTTTTNDAGKIMGTLPYMSPEEASGKADEIDVRSDVYSLGVIFYELMTDQLPYSIRKAALHEAVRVICEEPPRKPSTIDRSLRGDLETIALKALEKESARRYQSAAMLSEDVERYLTDQPILARRASGLYQFRKFVVRHKLFFVFAVASMVTVTAGRLWVEGLEKERRASTEMLFALQDLENAVIEAKLAETLHGDQRYTEAEPHYRNALATFQRLRRDERTGPALVGLGTLLLERGGLAPGRVFCIWSGVGLPTLLIQRGDPTEKDCEDAAEFFLDALVIFDNNPAAWLAERRQALEGLRTLYGPKLWDLPEELADIEAELATLANGE